MGRWRDLENTRANDTIRLIYDDASSEHGGNVQRVRRNQDDSRQQIQNIAGFGNPEFNLLDNLTFMALLTRISRSMDLI